MSADIHEPDDLASVIKKNKHDTIASIKRDYEIDMLCNEIGRKCGRSLAMAIRPDEQES